MGGAASIELDALHPSHITQWIILMRSLRHEDRSVDAVGGLAVHANYGSIFVFTIYSSRFSGLTSTGIVILISSLF